ncbi:MAG: hypothetical protein WA683_02935 [Pseudolabrys sp.]
MRAKRLFPRAHGLAQLNEAGVALLGEYNNEMPVPLELARRLRQSEADKAVLRNRIAQLTESGAA